MIPGGDFLDRVEALLREAKAVPAEEQSAFIRKRAGDDEHLRREVKAMLRAEASMGEGFLNVPISAALQSECEPAARRVGPWAVEEVLGAGGMGAVFRGRRADGAFEAEVAIKFVHEAFVDPTVRDRFLRERQILATLDHPNIARLLDGGIAEQGQPYLVMELVQGRSLLEYCDSQQATIEARLQLFDRVCHAVQHAHGHLIVHRDLKPSNILVDDTGRPRLLDFGIASILSDSERSGAVTATSERRFTPQYAAPEQVRGESVTVATDVYALGVILYELLAGARPYDITSGYTPEDIHTICETDPPRPSRRLDTATAEPATDAASIARSRGVDPAMLRRTLKGDLDHIIMTALRKEPLRRYATVEALREDLQRYRRGLPIAARPDTWRYRTTRFVGRHRVPTVATAVLAIVLIAATVISTMLAIRLNERTDALGVALAERQYALDEAIAQRATAEREYRRALSSSSTLIQTLAAVAANDGSSREQIVSHIRERIERLDAMTLPVSADAEIASRQALAVLARTIEAIDIALEQNHRVLELTEDRPAEADVRAHAYGQIGWLHLQRGDAEEAVAALLAARDIDQRVHSPNHLTLADMHLIEALLMTGDDEAARAILAASAIPPPPVDAFMHEHIRDLELRFSVPLQLSDPEESLPARSGP